MSDICGDFFVSTRAITTRTAFTMLYISRMLYVRMHETDDQIQGKPSPEARITSSARLEAAIIARA
jgi:hypothetical protein